MALVNHTVFAASVVYCIRLGHFVELCNQENILISLYAIHTLQYSLLSV